MLDRLDEVLSFWFGESADQGEIIARQRHIWFGKDEKTDALIARRFGDLVESAAARRLDDAEMAPRQRLAEILLLDQFPRNIHRGNPRAFSGDALAVARAGELLAEGVANSLSPIEKVFVYLPFEHSENLYDQKKSVALFHLLLEGVPPELKMHFSGFYDYAVRHCEIISRFGRFPHRNAILGRESTPAEERFLLRPDSSF